MICSASVQGCTPGVGVSVVLHVSLTMLITVGIKIIVRCRPHRAWELNVQIPVLALQDAYPNVPRGCRMNSGKSALESGFCGGQGLRDENCDSAGGTCSESQRSCSPATSLHLCFMPCSGAGNVNCNASAMVSQAGCFCK